MYVCRQYENDVEAGCPSKDICCFSCPEKDTCNYKCEEYDEYELGCDCKHSHYVKAVD